MPRRKDPVADLKTHRQRVADMAKKENELMDEASRALGREMIAAGLDDWSAKDRLMGLKRLAEEGPTGPPKGSAKAQSNGAAGAGSETPPAGSQA